MRLALLAHCINPHLYRYLSHTHAILCCEVLSVLLNTELFICYFLLNQMDSIPVDSAT